MVIGGALPAGRWLMWIVMLIIAILLISAGLQGTPGSLIAALITPAALKTQIDTQNQSQSQPASSSGTTVTL